MIWVWICFISFILALFSLDLGVFHRKSHVVGVREALVWSAIFTPLTLALIIVEATDILRVMRRPYLRFPQGTE